MLNVIGVGDVAERVYETLLTDQPCSVTALADATGMTPQRVRGALRVLETHGLASRKPGRPARYTAPDPSIALDVLLLRHEGEIKRARIRAQELTERFHQAEARHNSAHLVEIIIGREAVMNRVVDAYRSARREVRSFDKPPYATQPVPTGNDAEAEFLRRGGVVRIIYERASVEVPGRLPGDLELGPAIGTQDRVVPHLPMKLILIDDRLAIIPLQADPTVIESTVVVHRSALLEAISALFETLWRTALPLELAVADSRLVDQPSEEERRILAFLTSGLPDDAIARQLGLSDRTYQRRIHDLLERLQARTRFQLARQAGRRGWFDED